MNDKQAAAVPNNVYTNKSDLKYSIKILETIKLVTESKLLRTNLLAEVGGNNVNCYNTRSV